MLADSTRTVFRTRRRTDRFEVGRNRRDHLGALNAKQIESDPAKSTGSEFGRAFTVSATAMNATFLGGAETASRIPFNL
ncbi:hypothetical protein [Saccharibacillus sp. JS10]|uniref:hypothetical protein n=1 Tax=Saccharibacillus sp. JS10 TaxID=2950552 RepID=UPI00210BD5E6|nr:hypothetical protein [Saccharibacillus sp. JS10]MCQ4086328.1 hypothetical protein [Saccharibacillus sp. JS10]